MKEIFQKPENRMCAAPGLGNTLIFHGTMRVPSAGTLIVYFMASR